MAYFTELRTNWRPMVASVIGLASGMSIIGTITNVMAPHFMREFGWSKEDFSYVNSLSIFTVIMLPIAGRLADLIGVRRTAAIGVIVLPLTFVALSTMTGDIRIYIVLFLLQAGLCITTTISVYSRIVVQYIQKARGLALGIAGSAPAVMGLVGGPILNQFVLDHGWRTGYQALAALLFTTGVIALLMAPAHKAAERPAEAVPKKRWRRVVEDYPVIARKPAFWLMVVALLLINLPQTIAIAQLGLVALDNGVASADVGFIVSALSIGMLVGRLTCGVALDHWPAPIVATVSLVLPSVGLFLLASSLDTFPVVMIAILLFGLAYGAEGDIIGFLVVRIFGVKVYSSVMGLMTAVMSTTTSFGAALAAYTIAATGGYTLFLTITATTALVGSLLFLLLPLFENKEEQLALANAE